MRRILVLSLFCLIAFWAKISMTAYADDTNSSPVAEAAVVSQGTIMLDPGHGGSDPGALGLYGLIEKHLTLDIASRISELLQKAGYSVLLTRNDDRTVQLADRTDMANSSDIKLFVSVHINAAPSPSGNGIEVFYKLGDPESLSLAKRIQRKLVGQLGATDRGVKDGSKLWVIKKTKVPAVLVENLFITNQQDASKLFDESTHQTIAQAIADGILEYMGSVEVKAPEAPAVPTNIALPVPELPAAPIQIPLPVMAP